MKITALIGAATMLIAGSALAQSSPAAPRTTEKPPAVANPKDVNKTTMAPVGGKNSFTEAQVKKRLEDNGYTEVTQLQKDSESVWHGMAKKDGKSIIVMVDYQGNITTK